MTQRSALVVQILEKIGAPLAAAASEVVGTDIDPAKNATQMAVLLAKSVQTSVALSSSVDIRDSSDQADAVKLALAPLAVGALSWHFDGSTARSEDTAISPRVLPVRVVC